MLSEQKLHNLSKVKTVKERRLLQQRAERDVGTRATSNKEFKLEN
jgi:hypothetical protein